MWLASILQQLHFISWKGRRDSCAVFGSGSETCQEWPSPRSFKFFCSQRAPYIPCQGDCPVEAIAATQEFRWKALEEDLEMGERGRARILGCKCLHRVPAGIWPLGSGHPARAVTAHSPGCLIPSGIWIMLFTPPPLLLLGAGCSTFAVPAPGTSSSYVSVLLQSPRQSWNITLGAVSILVIVTLGSIVL